MTLRLWQRLFIAFAALIVLALAGFALWQQQGFRRGFLGYLDDVALERLQPAATRLADAYTENGSRWNFLRNREDRFAALVDWRRDALRRGDDPYGDTAPPDRRDAARTNGTSPDAVPPAPPPRDMGPGHDASELDAPPSDDGPPPGDPRDGPPPNAFDGPGPDRGHRPPHMPRGPPDLMPRLVLVDAAGERIVGNPRVPIDAPSVPVEVGGVKVGALHLAHLPQPSDAIDIAFAHDQLRTASIAALAMLALALVVAFAFARQLLKPVHALAAGTRALAAGEYGQRIAVERGDELGRLAIDFNHLAATLEHHRDARRRHGADIAHELRTPLSVLRGEIQALQDGVRAPTPEALDSLNAECERLSRLIEDLYQLSLADAGALEYRFETLDLGDIVDDAIALQRHACIDAGLAVETSIERATIRGDARRLAQLVDNLLANARRYTDAPGMIRVGVEATRGGARLIVDDTPPGVPVDALPRLFDRLYRVETSRSRAAGGAGLGLAICRAVVDAHGGRIDATPSPLGGLRITVDLPGAPA